MNKYTQFVRDYRTRESFCETDEQDRSYSNHDRFLPLSTSGMNWERWCGYRSRSRYGILPYNSVYQSNENNVDLGKSK